MPQSVSHILYLSKGIGAGFLELAGSFRTSTTRTYIVFVLISRILRLRVRDVVDGSSCLRLSVTVLGADSSAWGTGNSESADSESVPIGSQLRRRGRSRGILDVVVQSSVVGSRDLTDKEGVSIGSRLRRRRRSRGVLDIVVSSVLGSRDLAGALAVGFFGLNVGHQAVHRLSTITVIAAVGALAHASRDIRADDAERRGHKETELL